MSKRLRNPIAACLAAALLVGCASKDNGSVVSAMCRGPSYDDLPKDAQIMSAAKWSLQRFTCIEHFARFYAIGQDSAQAIADVVTKWECESPTRRS